MLKLGKVLTDLGFNEEQQEDLLYLLRLAGCFDPERLRRDLKKQQFPEQLISNAIELTQTYDRKAWLTCFDTCTENQYIENTKLWLAAIVCSELSLNQPWHTQRQSELNELTTAMSKHTFTPNESNYDTIFILAESKSETTKRIEYAKELLDHQNVKLDNVYLILPTNVEEFTVNELKSLPTNLKLTRCHIINAAEFENTIKQCIDNRNKLTSTFTKFSGFLTKKPFLALIGKNTYENEFPIIKNAFSINNESCPQIIVPKKDKLTIEEMFDLFRKPFEEKILRIQSLQSAPHQINASASSSSSTTIAPSHFWNFYRLNQQVLGTIGFSSLFILLYNITPSYSGFSLPMPDMSQLSQYSQQVWNTGSTYLANSQLPERGREMLIHGFWAGWEITKKIGAAAYENFPSAENITFRK